MYRRLTVNSIAAAAQALSFLKSYIYFFGKPSLAFLFDSMVSLSSPTLTKRLKTVKKEMIFIFFR